jgi:tRNA-intron endonuclease
VVQIIDSSEQLTAADIVKAGRLATTVKKSFILSTVNEEIRYLEFNWWKA